MTDKKTVSVRLQKPLYQDISDYKAARGISESDALRELLRKGLRYDDMEQKLAHIETRIEQIEEQQQSSLLSRIFGR